MEMSGESRSLDVWMCETRCWVFEMTEEICCQKVSFGSFMMHRSWMCCFLVIVVWLRLIDPAVTVLLLAGYS